MWGGETASFSLRKLMSTFVQVKGKLFKIDIYVT